MAEKKQEPKATPSTKPSKATEPTAKSAANAKPKSNQDKAAKPAATKKKTEAAVETAKTAAPKAAKPSTARNKTAAAKEEPAANTVKAQTKKTAAATVVTPSDSAEKTKTTAKTNPEAERQAKAEKSGRGCGASKFAAITKNKKLSAVIIAAVSLVLVLAIVLGAVFGAKSCNTTPSDGNGGITIEKPGNGNFNEGEVKPTAPYDNVSFGNEKKFSAAEIAEYNDYKYDTESFKTNTTVGTVSTVIGTVDRVIPEKTRDEGLGAYPKYGSTLSTVIGSSADKVAARNALIRESSYLTATGTSNAGGGQYTWMDKDGYLYSGSTAEPVPTYDSNGQHRRLYKHSASDGLYMGNVAPDEKAIIKQVTMRPRTYTRGYGVTGVYAPAGELIKIQMSGADMDATGGIVIHIGQALFNGKANNIWAAKGQMQRIPHLLNTMQVTKATSTYDEQTDTYTAYVGSFIGGPLYIRNESVTFTATISGGVAYSHFILGYTTKAEFEKNAQSSAPYFDLEVWDRGVLHSGPKYYAQSFSYEDIYNAAVLWDKIATVTTTNGTNQGIVFLYDPFVAAGAAVAFPGQGSVNCPAGWMTASLNYNAIVTSGSWGNLHEYHHNFQNYGIGDTGEVTNNGLTLVSYSLFTKISAARQVASYGGAGLSGWNQYTSATWALNRVNLGGDNIKSTNGLAVYSTLLHNFGQDIYIKARGTSGVNYLNKYAQLTHQDFTYFAQKVTGYTGTTLVPAETQYPTFVPVSSVYQTGRTYKYTDDHGTETREITTMQPYIIPTGKDFTVDLRPYNDKNDKGESTGQYKYGSVVIGDGFSYTIKGFNAEGINGKFVEDPETEGVYKYTPDGDKPSGKIYVTLGITTESGETSYNGRQLDDVDLILEFQPSHESTKSTLERTTYYFTEETKYSDAREAYENDYAGNITDRTYSRDHSNPTQNCNTDIWYYPDNDANHQKYPDAKPEYFVDVNSVDELRGKLYFAEEGKYRIYLRGRKNCALYYSLDGGATYELGTYIADDQTSANWRQDKYIDLELPAESWVYFKEVLINSQLSGSMASFIGLGLGTWSKPMYNIVTKHYKADGTEVESEDDPEYDHSVTKYYDAAGKEVTEEEANNTALVAPTSIAYLNAYRSTYEFPDNKDFTSEYFYVRGYNYNYTGEPEVVSSDLIPTYIADQSNYVPWRDTAEFNISNLFDGNPDTYIHSGDGNANKINAKHPAIFTVDLGKEITANTLRLYTSKTNNNHRNAFPRNFTLQGSLDGETYFDMGSWTDKSAPAEFLDLALSGTFTFKYYKLTVTATRSGTERLAIYDLQFVNVLRLTGNNKNNIPLDDSIFSYEGNWNAVNALSTYGHIYEGQKDSTLKFEFEGTRIGFVTNSDFDNLFEVIIDGKRVDSITLKEATGDYGLTYLTDKLENKKHTVVLKCLGKVGLDSVVYFNEAI